MAIRIGLFREVVVMALDTVRTNKMRSALTVLGVVIGITSIAGMTSMIRGFDQSLRDMIGAIEPRNTTTELDADSGATTAVAPARRSTRILIRKSGWSESNRRLPRPKRGTLTRLSYTPSSYKRAYSMAVCAHELALRYLVEDQAPAVLGAQPSEIALHSQCMAPP